MTVRPRPLVAGIAALLAATALAACQPTTASTNPSHGASPDGNPPSVSASPSPSTGPTCGNCGPVSTPPPKSTPATTPATPAAGRPTVTVSPYGPVAPRPTVYLVKVGGGSYGCGDALVPAEEVADSGTPVRAAITQLLAKKGMGTEASYNALGQSSLQYADGRYDAATGVVEVRLTGKLVTSGTCDIPRMIGQLEMTALSAAQAKTAKIYVNDQPLKDALSER